MAAPFFEWMLVLFPILCSYTGAVCAFVYPLEEVPLFVIKCVHNVRGLFCHEHSVRRGPCSRMEFFNFDF